MKAPLLKKDEAIISKILYETIRVYDRVIKDTKERIASGKYHVPSNEKMLAYNEKKRSELMNVFEKF